MAELPVESEVVRSVLLSGLQDWVDPGLIYHLTEYLGAPPPDRRLMTLAVMVEVVTTDLMVPGDVSEGRFVAWEGSSAEVVERLVLGLRESGSPIRPGDVAWFENTQAGDAVARDLLDG